MYRQLLTILLLSSIVLQFLQPVVIVINYRYNRSQFEKYCINKNLPARDCHGQCQMRKKLKEEQQRDTDSKLQKFSPHIFAPYNADLSVPKQEMMCSKSVYPALLARLP